MDHDLTGQRPGDNDSADTATGTLEEPEIPAAGSPQIWAVGGGKGGTGKSFFTSNLAFSLASMDKKVILIDADLGGANLHSFLGIKRPRTTISTFFEKKIPLRDLIMQTSEPRIGLISGDLQSLDADDIKYTQKLKLFRHIRALEADYIIIDLGAGTHNNTMDTFLLADRMLVVTVPAVTALENLYQFIKNVYYRKLKMAFGKRGLRDRVVDTWRSREELGIKSLRELVDRLREESPEMEDFFQKEVDAFRISLVLNMIRHSADIQLGGSVKSVIRKYLGFHADYAGYVRYDECVLRCLNNGTPFYTTYPSNRSTREIEMLTRNILSGRHMREVM